MKNKENVLNDYKKMIINSWTYQKMTTNERERLQEVFNDIQTREALKGSYKQRWEILQAIYTSYLMGLNYNGFNWREND